MTREIKFRAWNGKKIIDNPIITDNSDGNQTSCVDLNVGLSISDLILMQYTGLKDKNGNEIWEGDIVKYTSTNFIGIVKFSTLDTPNFRLWSIKSDIIRDLKGFSDTEIIGNIYQNPELLNGGNNE